MEVTMSEFKSKLGAYITLSATEEIVITRNGKRVARLTRFPGGNDTEAGPGLVDSLVGILPPSVTLDEARKERVSRHEGNT